MLSNYNIKYICTIYTRLDTMSYVFSRISLRDQGNISTIEAQLLWSGYGRVVYTARYQARRLVLQRINGVSSIPVE